jgi:hypothetical protein
MCVILLCPPKIRPSRNLLELCDRSNPHGAGIAWRESGMVHWFKTDQLDQIELLARRKAGEIVIHFRIASVGGVTPALRHPFPVSPRAGLAPSGSARTVLFQNGTWSGWQEAMDRAESEGLVIPGGEWSDTRAAALLSCGITAAGRADFFGKVAAPSRWVWFSAKGTETFGQWYESDGIRFSNLHWKPMPRAEVPVWRYEPPAKVKASKEKASKAKPTQGELEMPRRHITKLEAELDWLYERNQTAKDFYSRFPKPVSK